MSGKKIFTIIVSVGIVAALAIYIVRQNAGAVPQGGSQSVAAQSTTGTPAPAPSDQTVSGSNQPQSPQSGTPSQQPQPQKQFPNDYSLTKPDQELSMGNGSNNELRIYNVTLDASGFTPSEIVVNQGDVLQINLKAGAAPVDLNSYDLHTYLWAPAGQTQSGSIVLPKSGLFIMSCKNNCAGANNPTLALAVLPK